MIYMGYEKMTNDNINRYLVWILISLVCAVLLILMFRSIDSIVGWIVEWIRYMLDIESLS